MTTVQQLAVEAELEHLAANALQQGWLYARTGDAEFTFGIPSKDGSWLHLKVLVDRYPTLPPAWHWHNPTTGALDQPADMPANGGFFHGNGVICAPWNRLAYKSVDARGPHEDWSIEGDWKSNPKTLGTTTLSAMAQRIALETAQSSGRRSG
ncbi:MAG: hypothetical protein JSS77_13005 [Acidobacteria bacterium]|nr:hypothetical protein [Acidobacteriota bacterium]